MTLASRIWWAVVLVAVSSVLVTGIAGWLAARTLLLAEIDQGLRDEAQRFAERLPGPLAARLVLSHRREGIEWRLLAEDGARLRQSDQWPEQIALEAWPDSTIIQYDGADGSWRLLQVPMVPWQGRSAARDSRRRSGDEGGRPAILTRPDQRQRANPRERPATQANPLNGAMMQVAVNVSGVYRDLRRLAYLLATVMAVVSGVAILLAGRLRDALLAPVSRLTTAIQELPADAAMPRLHLDRLPGELEQVRSQLDEWLARLAHTRSRERRTMADIAHELRTPLAALQSQVEFAAASGALSATLSGQMGLQLRVLYQRFEGLLLLARADAGAIEVHRELLPLAELLAEAWAPLAQTAANRGVSLDVRDEGVDISADRLLATMMVSNLLGNAVAHTPETGTVLVESSTQSGAVVLRLSNPTVGQAVGPLPHAFEPFWRGDQTRSDTQQHAGLGLAVVARMLDLHQASYSARISAEQRFVLEIQWPTAPL